MRLPGLLCLLTLIAGQPAVAGDGGGLAGLRAAALAAANADRRQHGLPPLRLNDGLNAAAQAHAEDMLRRGYFDHASPEGRMVGERFQERGGSRWALVEENISYCTGCEGPLDTRRVRLLEQGWMESPTHRENILRHGLTGFGFGVVGAAGGVIYAVQTFAGPGAPRSREAAEAPETVPPAAQVELALRQFNAARQAANLPPLLASRSLSEIARTLVSNDPDEIVDPGKMTRFDALADEGSAWREVRLESSRCGGCGTRPTADDVLYFADEFLHEGAGDANPLAREMDVAGFAMTVDGNGMKSAVLLVARQR